MFYEPLNEDDVLGLLKEPDRSMLAEYLPEVFVWLMGFQKL